MSATLDDASTAGRPLVPSARESALGRQAAVTDLGQPRFVERPGPGEAVRPSRREAARAFARGLNPMTIEGPKAPLLLLTVIGALSGFFTQASTLAQPTIQTDLGIDLSVLFGVGLWASAVVGLAGPWLGYVADRRNRVWQARIGVAVQALGPLLVGVAHGIGGVFLGTTVLGVGQKVAQPATQTLLIDYYPLAARIRVVFFLFQVDGVFAVLAIPVAGGLISVVGWRPVFLVIAVAMLVGAASLFLLRETVRGFWERKELGATDDDARVEQPPVSWAEGWRTAASITIVQRQWLAAPFLSVASTIGFLTFSQIFFARQFGLEVGARSGILFVQSLCGFLALVFLAPVASRVVGTRPRVIVVLQAVQGVLTAGLYGLLVSTHDLLFAVVITVVNGTIGSTLFPVTFTLTQAVLPPRMRAFGLQTLYAMAVPGQVVIAAGIVTAGANSLGAIVVVIAVCAVVAALIQLSALPHVERDIANATLQAAVDDELTRGEGDEMLVIRRLDVEYAGSQVLFGVDLTVRRGEVVALLGTNGAGKSTVLRAIAGSHAPTGGVIFVDGKDITHVPPHESARAGVVVVPGGHGVCPGMTVAENLRIAAWLRRDDRDYVEARLAAALDLFPALRDRLDVDAGSMSGGEQQMLALAQSYLMEPRLLLIDELSLGLAPQVVESLLDSLRAINATGTTIVLVEQSINVALTIADRAVFLDKGQVRFDGPTPGLLARPDLVRAVFMGGAASTGRVRRRAPAPLSAGEGSALVVDGVTVRFGGIRALSDIHLEVAPREIVGILGPNGAGKTTLFDAISGLVPVESGRVLVKGSDVTRLGLDRRAAAGLGRSFQSARLFPSMTVRENIAVAMQRRVRARNPLLAAVWAPPARAAERRVRERVDDIVELMGLEAFADKFVGELSTGSRRAVDVGCVMVAAPDVLLLDEPSSGLAQAETEALTPVIQRIVRDTGCCVVLVEHDLPLLASVSHRLVAMETGRVIASGGVDEVVAHPEVQRAYLSASREVLLRSDSAFAEAFAAAGVPSTEMRPG